MTSYSLINVYKLRFFEYYNKKFIKKRKRYINYFVILIMSDSRPVPEHKIPKPHVGFWFTIKPFFIGGLSGCIATACIQPLDTIKVRI